MSLREFLAELRHRGVLKVATVNLATGVVVLEAGSHLLHNFEAPHWVLKVFSAFVIFGFPIACLMAWGFELSSQGVHSAPPMNPDAPAKPGRADTVFGGLLALIFALVASIDGLNVAARTSSFSFAGKGSSIKEIGDTLHVRHVLEGSVRRSGQKLRVTAQLIDVESGFHLYSQAYDREVKDIFEIRNEIAREIVTALMPKLGLKKDTNLVKQGTSNIEADNLRLQARPWQTAPNPETAGAAIEKLRQAIALDPKYADACGDLAYVQGYMSSWASDPVPFLLEASSSATMTLLYSPTNVIGLLWQAYVSMLVNHNAAATAGRYARAAGGDLSVLAFEKAYLYDGPLGRCDEAIAMLKDAERKDPLAPNLKFVLIEMYLASGRVAEATACAEDIQKLGSTAPDALELSGRTFVAAGKIERARESLADLRAVTSQDFQMVVLLQFEIDRATGDRADAQQLLERLLRQNAASRPNVSAIAQSKSPRHRQGSAVPGAAEADGAGKRRVSKGDGAVAIAARSILVTSEETMESYHMAYYVIFDVTIHDLPKYQEYMAKIKPVIEASGGRYLVRGGAHMVIEGDWKPTRLVIFEFPSQAAAQSFYVSPEYQSLKALRMEASSANIVGVEGV